MTRQQSSTREPGNKKHASSQSSSRASGRGSTTVREAGHKGGQRVRELVNEGREAEQRGTRH
ncbi:hypothetical protein [Fulvimonas yonginensis]|uniref:Stress-induced protein n=1 Tax=Fulvimonas yonginensis TaxID=1495200 RepID=A0ABU8JBZ9_9GAMM